MTLNWPLMNNNITKEDLQCLTDFIGKMPRLTQSENVLAFENEWSEWLGVKYSVFVNSGSSANFLTMAVLSHLYDTGEVILPPITWVSDVVSVIQNGFKPVFADINPRTLCLDDDAVINAITSDTRAVFVTHVQGFNGLTDRLLDELKERNILLIEDVCEAHGSTFKGVKTGTFGLISNFSFYFGHHMSTIEGGMVCTDDPDIYQVLRMMRSHGMVRESSDPLLKQQFSDSHKDLKPDFIFAYPGFNFRNSELGAVLGRNQLNRLDQNNQMRRQNFELFINHLDSSRYRTEFDMNGSCNYAFNLIVKEKDSGLRDRVEQLFIENDVEFRRGSSGGGNQLRQPYLKNYFSERECEKFPEAEHVHFYGYYIGNYPDLDTDKILKLCSLLNDL